MTMLRTIGHFLLCVSTAACSATVEGSPGAGDEALAGDEATPSAGDQLLNRFGFEDLELSFYKMDVGSTESPAQIGIEESFGSVDYLSALRKDHGQLTSLEIFKAFAPAGLEPHPALLAQHEAEARAFERAGNDLDVRDIDARGLAIDKAIPADCLAQVLPDISPRIYANRQTRDIGADGQFFYLCVGSSLRAGSLSQATSDAGCVRIQGKNELTVGLCNDTASANSTEFWTQVNPARSTPTSTQRTSVAPGRAGRFTILPVPPPLDTAFITGLAVIGRNSTANVANFHRQLSAIGVGG